MRTYEQADGSTVWEFSSKLELIMWESQVRGYLQTKSFIERFRLLFPPKLSWMFRFHLWWLRGP